MRRYTLQARITIATACLAFASMSAAACGDDEGSDGAGRTCGDGRCRPEDCETSVRCPEDCGTCIGTECDVSSAVGSCGEGCTSSCDCNSQAELCTATYGEVPGRCVPVDCLACANFQRCQYAPDADGACQSVTCT